MEEQKRRIVAFGGGHIGGDFFDEEKHSITTTALDNVLVNVVENQRGPVKVLFIPTAMKDSEDYCQTFKKHYDSLGHNLEISNLLLYSNPRRQEIQKAVNEAHIIYVGGGSTLNMLEKWEEVNLFPILEKAYKNGKILSGLSAGANCWCKYFGTDSRMSEDDKKDLQKAKETFAVAYNLHPLLNIGICPHYTNGPTYQREAFLYKIKDAFYENPNLTVYGVDENAALFFENEKLKKVVGTLGAKAFELHWQEGKIIEKLLPVEQVIYPLKKRAPVLEQSDFSR